MQATPRSVTRYAYARPAPDRSVSDLRRSSKMKANAKPANRRPLVRFALGFAAAGTVTFTVVLLYSERLKEEVVGAGGLALVLGFFAGLLSAFGKKLFRAILTFAREVIMNP